MELRQQFINFLQRGITLSDEVLEEFFIFIDFLEKIEQKNKEQISVLVDCYLQIGRIKKAVDIFGSIYDSKNKKEIKNVIQKH